ncbi:flagellar hook assembly protein FlgD [Bryobacter aggregatus]|uniref:flagellar hook assembly protein FlgD n=1 Tax=Bryobacter aggregatus TaxID=360054 RepID=UPI00068BB4D9|nr:flagellar hook capping FlgD N-terminal domain-containing protein [Bryobacter aggregatus]
MTRTTDLSRSYQMLADNSTGKTETKQDKTQSADPNDLANKEVFLQLLIAQIKNQDPTSPTDSIQYITQLSQFTGVEQLVDIKQTLKQLSAAILPASTSQSNTKES